MSAMEIRKLFLRMQTSRLHLEKLPPLLHSIALSSHSQQPSSYVEFSYRRPSRSLDAHQMLTVPYFSSWEARPKCLSLWLAVAKYPLQVWLHVLTAFTGDVYLQLWASACTGDVVIR